MKIEVKISNDAGEVVSRFTSYNCVPAGVVTVFLARAMWAIQDDAGNTYTREPVSPEKISKKPLTQN